MTKPWRFALAFWVFFWTLPVSPQEVSVASYAELSGMFAHAAGRIDNQDGTPKGQWAFGHEHAPAGCSDIHWWSATPALTYSHYERMCIVGEWVRWMGMGKAPSGDLTIRVFSEGQAGQRIVKAHPTLAPYGFVVEGELVSAVAVYRYIDTQTWVPNADGSWTQYEEYRYTHAPGAADAGWTFQSVVTMRPRNLFAELVQTWVNPSGQIQTPSLGRTNVTWTW